MSLIKTFKLRNKLEIDIFVNDELLLTITRPISKNSETIDFDEFIYLDLLDGYAEMYSDPNKPNSFIYYTSSCGNQMALILTKSEANNFLKLTELESDSDSDYTDTETSTKTPTETLTEQSQEQSEEESQELHTIYRKVRVLDRKLHPTDQNYYIYMIDIHQDVPITCVSDDFYEIGDLVNVDCYKKLYIVKGIFSYGRISEYIDTQKEIKEISSRFASWFGF